jgi:hypothetical protein
MIIWVVHEPGEETHLISLSSNSICLYEILFSPDTPDAVIIAVIDAALSPLRPQAGRGRTRQATGQRRTPLGGR